MQSIKNLDSKISHNITDTPHYSGKISSISSDKQLIIINKEKFRILSRKKIVYDSLDDEESAEDVIIENKQALEMVEMHRNILENMMDAFASITGNFHER